jgi:hypothetical protein
MHQDALLDELRQVGRDVVEGERLLAEQEALPIALKRENKDVRKVEAALEQMREDQRCVSKTVSASFPCCSPNSRTRNHPAWRR